MSELLSRTLLQTVPPPQAVPVQQELFAAAAEGNLPRVQQLLQKGADATGSDAQVLNAGVATQCILVHTTYISFCDSTYCC